VSADPNAIRILAVDDRPLFRSGIAALLATQPDMNLVAGPPTGEKPLRSSVRTAHI